MPIIDKRACANSAGRIDMVMLKYCKSIQFRWGAERYMTPIAKRLNAEYKGLQKDLITKRKFEAEGEMPFKKPAFDGVFLPSYLDRVNETFLGINLREGQRLVDLGSGDGRVVFLATLFGAQAVGIEGDKELCGIALNMQNHLLSIPGFEQLRNAKIINADFFEEGLSSFDVVFLYDPQSNRPDIFHKRLVAKFKAELKPGSLCIRHSYSSSKAFVEQII